MRPECSDKVSAFVFRLSTVKKCVSLSIHVVSNTMRSVFRVCVAITLWDVVLDRQLPLPPSPVHI